METIRTLGAGAGFRWLADAYALGRRAPGTVLGGAAWMMLVFVGVSVALGLFNLFVLAGHMTSWIASFSASMLLMLPVLLIFAMATSGYLRLLSDVDAGRAASAFDVFAGFRDFGTASRVFAIMFVVMLVQQLVMIAAVVAFMPDVARWYVEAIQMRPAAQAPALPAGFWGAYGVMLAVMMVTYAVQGIAALQVILGNRTVPAALRDGVVGVLRNLPALLVCMVAGISVALLVFIAIIIAIFLLVLVGKLGAPWLALVIGIPLYLLAAAVVFAFSFAMGYAMWRDIAGRVEPSGVEA